MFATGKSTGGMALEVTWRSGAVSVVGDVKSNRLYELMQSGAGDTHHDRASRPHLSSSTPANCEHTHVDLGLMIWPPATAWQAAESVGRASVGMTWTAMAGMI